ncbi:MAG: tRNA threonylcarbamoyladenosine dehydratase [Burkholderiaceae bacterium]
MTEPSRRFGGTQRLLGDAALARLQAAHVVVVGMGGVGSWAAEALARTGVGQLTLIDEDHVAESNINRQVHALETTLGAPKVQVMQSRINTIAACTVNAVEDFVTVANVAEVIDPSADFVIDAIDQTAVKAAMAAQARRRSQKIVVCGAAGGRFDPLKLTRNDLAVTSGDALLAGVRARLRRSYGYPRQHGKRFGILALHSTEQAAATDLSAKTGANSVFPLACSGYGSIMTVTASMGLAAAAAAIEYVLKSQPRAAKLAG